MDSHEAKIDFYNDPGASIQILTELLHQDGKATANYTTNFLSVDFTWNPDDNEDYIDLENNSPGEAHRERRTVLLFWTILFSAGFKPNLEKLNSHFKGRRGNTYLDPTFTTTNKSIMRNYISNKNQLRAHSRVATNNGITSNELTKRLGRNDADGNFLRQEIQEEVSNIQDTEFNVWDDKVVINDFNRLSQLFEELKDYIREQSNNSDLEPLRSSSGGDLLKTNELAMLNFLFPANSVAAGPKLLTKYRPYHSEQSDSFIKSVINFINEGKTVIFDLSNENENLVKYFSNKLVKAIFDHQQEKFTSMTLENYVQLYFEEAHNLFPDKEKDMTNIYTRIAKEGAKYNIGMIYSTQSPSTIQNELINQTENLFALHFSSQDEVNSLGRSHFAFESVKEDLLNTKSVGYVRVLTNSHRFVIPVQAENYNQ